MGHTRIYNPYITPTKAAPLTGASSLITPPPTLKSLKRARRATSSAVSPSKPSSKKAKSVGPRKITHNRVTRGALKQMKAINPVPGIHSAVKNTESFPKFNEAEAMRLLADPIVQFMPLWDSSSEDFIVLNFWQYEEDAALEAEAMLGPAMTKEDIRG